MARSGLKSATAAHSVVGGEGGGLGIGGIGGGEGFGGDGGGGDGGGGSGPLSGV